MFGFNTVNHYCPIIGMWFPIHPEGWINDNTSLGMDWWWENGVHINWVAQCTSPMISPPDFFRPSRNLSVVGDVQPNTSLLLAAYLVNHHRFPLKKHWSKYWGHVPSIASLYFWLQPLLFSHCQPVVLVRLRNKTGHNPSLSRITNKQPKTHLTPKKHIYSVLNITHQLKDF